jgi:hypothetical protein
MKLKRDKISIQSLHEPTDDVAYWLSRPPEERFAAMQLLRENAYGKEAANAPLNREIFEVVQMK